MSSLPDVIVIATHNAKKAGEMSTILGARFPDITWRTLADYPGAPEPEETAGTYAGNATIKAESACAFTGEWCLADDAGLEIDALHGEPGVHSKRFEGEGTSFAEKMGIILHRMLLAEDRSARFQCWVALARPSEPTVLFSAICEGQIAREPSGGGGFGYDPIFYLPELKCTMADLTATQKHAVSHRGKVLSEVGDYLKSR